ncbi:MAG: UDP-2,3-diacylglucosamine diphosphatase LpxI [Planctomycetota bacterium]
MRPDTDPSPAIPVQPGDTVGLLAAWGNFPREVARAMRARGLRVHCLGVRRHADESLRQDVDGFQWIGAGQLGGAIRKFRAAGVRHATMAGKFHKVELYRPGAWWRYLPDWTFVRTFYPHLISFSGDRRDDTLLGAFVEGFSQGGVTMGPATDYAPQLLAQAGPIAGGPPTAREWADIRFGWRLAKQMGGLDIGQSVCVRDRAVIAVEAIEGTDRCIQRAGELCPRGGFTVVKTAKPEQDMRFDVPTVGAGTLRTIADAGGRWLVVEAERTILLDRGEFAAEADRLGVRVIAVDPAVIEREIAA